MVACYLVIGGHSMTLPNVGQPYSAAMYITVPPVMRPTINTIPAKIATVPNVNMMLLNSG
jgi:hypothetical protein